MGLTRHRYGTVKLRRTAKGKMLKMIRPLAALPTKSCNPLQYPFSSLTDFNNEINPSGDYSHNGRAVFRGLSIPIKLIRLLGAQTT